MQLIELPLPKVSHKHTYTTDNQELLLQAYGYESYTNDARPTKLQQAALDAVLDSGDVVALQVCVCVYVRMCVGRW